MKLLLDECLPRQLINHLSGHQVSTVPKMRWVGIKNGALLKLMESRFDTFITMDGNLQYQQNIRNLNLSIIVQVAAASSIESLAVLAPKVLDVMKTIESGHIVKVSID